MASTLSGREFGQAMTSKDDEREAVVTIAAPVVSIRVCDSGAAGDHGRTRDARETGYEVP